LLGLLGAHPILHVSRIRVKGLKQVLEFLVNFVIKKFYCPYKMKVNKINVTFLMFIIFVMVGHGHYMSRPPKKTKERNLATPLTELQKIVAIF
jgi:hypothetical protein